ncbi:MAG: RICIN domain-containing protein [Coriobacteriales bacterium]|nr:RICIN domain-containing protein [Coriobacteriales bacterium]
MTFKNWDGSVLKTQSGIAYGSAATAPTTNPTRSGYIFVGWDKDFSNVTANLTVTAQFALDFNNKVMCITNGSLRFDVPGNSVISGAVLNLWTATHGPNQRFRFVSTGDGYYKIVCVGSGMLLDVRGASATAGTPVIQWPEASGGAANNQKWKIEVSGSGYRLVTKLNSNYCIDTTSSKLSTGNTLVLAKVSSGKASQTYKFEVKGQTSGITDLGTYTIAASSATNQLIDIEGASLADGAQALLWKKNGNANQKFLFSYDSSSGYYVIQCVKSSAVFDVYGGSTAAGTRIIQWPVNYQFNQKWDVVQVSGNTYQIYSARSSMALDAYGGSTANNTKVIVWPENGGANQKWVIKAA